MQFSNITCTPSQPWEIHWKPVNLTFLKNIIYKALCAFVYVCIHTQCLYTTHIYTPTQTHIFNRYTLKTVQTYSIPEASANQPGLTALSKSLYTQPSVLRCSQRNSLQKESAKLDQITLHKSRLISEIEVLSEVASMLRFADVIPNAPLLWFQTA